MKKKIFSFVVLSFIFGGVVSATAINYYADLLYAQKDQMSDIVKDEYEEKMDHAQFQVHNDMIMFVETERERIQKEAIDYMNEKVQQEQSDLMLEHSQAIEKAADDILDQLKQDIDQLFED